MIFPDQRNFDHMHRVAQVTPAVQPPCAALALTDEFDPDAWRDFAVHLVAQRFALSLNVARVVADHAGLRGGRQ